MIFPRNITFVWDAIECIDQNGLITNYTVYNASDLSYLDIIHGVTNMSITFTDLVPEHDYAIQVAGVNINGTGPYSSIQAGRTARQFSGTMLF